MIDSLKSFFSENVIWFLMIPALIIVLGVIKKFIPNYKDDNPVEEAVEKVIEEKTGIDVDLTPSSPEQKSGQEITKTP